MLRKDKYSQNQKRLCQQQELITENHVKSCFICDKSFKEYEKFGISNTPPCRYFQKELEKHVNSCNVCNQAKEKYLEDGVKIIPEMRIITAHLSEGKLPDVSIMKRVATYLFKELNMSSDEIKSVSENADRLARKSLTKGDN